MTAAGNAKAAGINNLAHYVLAVRLRESNQKIQPDLVYHGAHYNVSNGIPIVGVKLQNTAPVIVGKVHLKATVTGEGHKVVARIDQQNLNFAPTSSFDYQLKTLGQKALKTGRYRLNMTVKADNGYWKFDKLFDVTAQDSHKATAYKQPINWTQIALWVIEALAVLIVLSYVYRRIKQWLNRTK